MTETSDTKGHDWYLAQLKPGGLARAVENLARQQFVTLMPMRQVTRRVSGRLVPGAEPLFPGYLFVGGEAGRGDVRAINSTYGVSRLVSLGGGEPSRVPAGLVAALMARTGGDGFLLPEGAFLPGERVRVIDGPFARAIAEIEAIPSRDRIFALIEMMGRRVRAELAPDDLERL